MADTISGGYRSFFQLLLSGLVLFPFHMLDKNWTASITVAMVAILLTDGTPQKVTRKA